MAAVSLFPLLLLSRPHALGAAPEPMLCSCPVASCEARPVHRSSSHLTFSEHCCPPLADVAVQWWTWGRK